MPKEIEPDEVSSTLPQELEARLLDVLDLLERETARLEKLEKVRQADLAKHEKGLEAKTYADLLKQHLGEVKRGSETVTLKGYNQSGAEVEVEIPLDKKLSAKENMNAHYKRFQKSVKGVSKAGAKLAETREALARLGGVAGDLAAAYEIDEHEEIAGLLESEAVNALLQREADKGKKKGGAEKAPVKRGPFDDLPSSLRPRVYESIDGWTILCGKGARANDWLTTRIANGNDWFFHIASFPGAHVILRNQKGLTPPLETLLDCGQLCLHYSKMKKAHAASVHYVQCKYVRKPKGAKPGLVLVHGGKTLSVHKDEERLNRLLKRDNF